MALINNLYIFVEKEERKYGVSISEHPIEKGLPITDNVQREPAELSINGYLVDVGTYKTTTQKIKGRKAKIKKFYRKKTASQISVKIRTWLKKGRYVTYKGKSTLKNALITDYQETFSNSGRAFTMTIKEVRIAKSAYRPKKSKKKKTSATKTKTKKKKSNKRYHTVKKGQTLYTIAKKYYGNGTKMTTIYKANKKKIDKANKSKKVNKYTVYIGQKLLIP